MTYIHKQEWDQAWYYTISKIAGSFWPDELSFFEYPFEQEFVQKYKHVFENRIFRTLYACCWTRNHNLCRWQDGKGWLSKSEIDMTDSIVKINLPNHSFFNECSFIGHRNAYGAYDVDIIIYNNKIYYIPEYSILSVSKVFYDIYKNSLKI
jgi:hypothetical protein